MPGQKFYGSICLTDLIDQAKAKHSAFSKADNGKIYANVNVWLNDDVDKFGNIMSIQINPTKDKKDTEKQFYIGNMKRGESQKPINDRDTSNLGEGLDIPARTGSAPAITEPMDDLPF